MITSHETAGTTISLWSVMPPSPSIFSRTIQKSIQVAVLELQDPISWRRRSGESEGELRWVPASLSYTRKRSEVESPKFDRRLEIHQCGSSSVPFVAMMQSADLRYGADSPDLALLYRPLKL
jgi:hypothetical protein